MKLFEYTGDELMVLYYPTSGRVVVDNGKYGVSVLPLMLAKVTAAIRHTNMSFDDMAEELRMVCIEFSQVYRRGTQQEAHQVRAPR